MATFAQRMQDEIRRLARKELKQDVIALKQENVALRKAVSDLRKRLDGVARTTKKVEKKAAVVLESAPAQAAKPAEEEAPKARISGKTIRTLRAKLKLTQAEFAKLVNVSPQSVYQWEREDRQLRLRNATRAAVVEVRGMGQRAAKAKLEAMDNA